ncbi:MAG: hypothetical protein RLZZ436_4114 [Planctomycetota bacterium]|jgi:hypothetical protein
MSPESFAAADALTPENFHKRGALAGYGCWPEIQLMIKV